MSFQLLVRLIAWCLGVIVVGQVLTAVMELPNRKEGEGLDSIVRSTWIASLIGIPCLIVGLKGIRFGPEARRTRIGGLICVAGGIGLLMGAALMTFVAQHVSETLKFGIGVIAIGPYVVGLVLVYAGCVTIVCGIDIRAELSR